MNQKMSLLSGISIGAAAMYLLDPDRGKRRRALMRDQVAHQVRLAQTGLEKSARDLRQRLSGALAGRHWLPTDDAVPDEVLVARVRSRMGRITSHPGALEITASNGMVQVSGPILARERGRVLAGIRAVRGVKGVEDHLEVHKRPEDIPSLQTGRTVPRALQRRETLWSPSRRLVAIIGGGLLALSGISRRSIPGTAAGVIGAGLLVRGMTNMRLRRLVGIGARRPVITLQKTLSIQAPVEQVFALWTHYEAFPRVMHHLREVHRTQNGQSTWIAAGPLGLPIRWQAAITTWEPNKLICWRTVSGSTVSQTGSIRFEPLNTGGTRLDLRLSYTPPGGVLGYLLATLLGANPKRMLDQDLVQFKSLIEHGRTSAHGEKITRQQLLSQIAQSGPESALPVP
jgi:uncharacterized membrane protein/osmotically-inducible protein OsmY